MRTSPRSWGPARPWAWPREPRARTSKLADIEAVTDAALSRLDEQRLLEALLERVKAVLDADTATVLLLDRPAGQLVAAAATGIEEEVRQGVRVPLGTGFAGQVAATRQPVILNQVDHTTVRNPLLVERGIRSLLGVPLLAGGKVIGVLHVGSLTGRHFGPEDVELLQLAADRAALAVHTMMTQDDRQAAVALQSSLLPSALPAVEGTDLAARYVTGIGNVGGDWYDVFVLPSGKLALVIGDVAGSGLAAAVIMGRMRSALRSYALLADDDPAVALSLLDRKIQYFEPDAMATVLFAIYEPESGQLTIASAGHLPPVLAVQGQPPGPVELQVDPVIGVAPSPRRRSTVTRIPPGALLCLYTDGLVERRDQSLDTGIVRLADVVDQFTGTADAPGSLPLAEAACARVMRVLVGNAPAADDVAVVVLHRTASPEAGPATTARSETGNLPVSEL